MNEQTSRPTQDELDAELMLCARHNMMVSARLLIERGANVNGHNQWLSTPMHVAAEMGHELFCDMLLKEGASLNVKDDSEVTPLCESLFKSRSSMATWLIAQGANTDDPHAMQVWFDIFKRPLEEMTMRQAAILGLHLDRLKDLFMNHAPQGEGDGPKSLLQLAESMGEPEVLAMVQSMVAAASIDDVLATTKPLVSKSTP